MPGAVALLGVPFDAHSSFLRGPCKAPAAIRRALFDGASNLTAESGLELEGHLGWRDAGDLELPANLAAFDLITAAVDSTLEAGDRVLSLGGDHSISLPILRAYGKKYPELTVVQLDAHPDLYDELDGNRYSHACPFARGLEEGLITRLVQVGIRTANRHQRRQAERFGVETLEAWQPAFELDCSGPVYLTLDLDVLDPAFAPGVSHHEPGGLTTRQVIELIKRLPGELVGADVVELNPLRDRDDVTARVASKLVKEILSRLLSARATSRSPVA